LRPLSVEGAVVTDHQSTTRRTYPRTGATNGTLSLENFNQKPFT